MARKEGIGRRRHRSEAEGNPSRVDGSRRPDPYKATWSGDGFELNDDVTRVAPATERRNESGLEGARPAREMTLAPLALNRDVSNLAKTGTKCAGHENGFKFGVGAAGQRNKPRSRRRHSICLRRQGDLRQCRSPLIAGCSTEESQLDPSQRLRLTTFLGRPVTPPPAETDRATSRTAGEKKMNRDVVIVC